MSPEPQPLFTHMTEVEVDNLGFYSLLQLVQGPGATSEGQCAYSSGRTDSLLLPEIREEGSGLPLR